MAYKNFTNCTEEQYYEIIYSQDDTNRIKILFNNVELADADEYCEKLTVKNRILPDDGSKRFSLGNFVSKEAELILRDLPSTTTIQDQVSISIGTLVNESNDTYEYVPIGIFNIQDTPVTDQNKVTIKLRDNRVKFDYYYNAKPLIDEKGGKANYYQILDDICTQAGVTNKVGHFAGDDIEVSIYDNTITATSYVAKIAEQCGMIPVINRLGELEFINPKSDKATTQIESTATLQNVGSTQIDNIELIGNTTQETTTGKNLLSSSYLTSVTINNATNNDFTYTNLWATPIITNENVLKMFKPNTTYTISFKFKIIERPSSFGQYNTTAFFVLYNGSQGFWISKDIKNTCALNTWYEASSKITTPASLSNYRIMAYNFKDANNTTSGKIQISEMQIEENTVATSYEPYTYGASPNPSYAQEIKTVIGLQKIKTVGKNLFDKDNVNVLNGYVNYNTGVFTSPSTSNQKCFYIKVEPSTTYTWNGYTTSASVGYGLFTNVPNINDTANSFGQITLTKTITTGANDNYLVMFYTATTANVDLSTFQLELGSTATDYEPYQEQVSEINLGKNLYEGSQDFSGTWEYESSWETDSQTFNGCVVKKRAGSWAGINKTFPIVSGKTYTFSVYAKADESRSCGLYLSNAVTPNSSTINITTEWQRYSITFTANSNSTIRPRIENQTNSSTNYTYIACFQLERGTQATQYSEYFTPIELCKIGNYEDKIFKTTGKNLFSSEMELGIIDGTGANVSNNNGIRTKGYIPIEPDTTYYLSNDHNYNQNLYYYDSNFNYVRYSETTGSFTTPSGVAYLRTRTAAGSTQNDLTTLYQLELGNQKTDYEPYSNNEWYVKKAIGKVVLNGSETWTTGGTSTSGKYRLKNNDISTLVKKPSANNVKIPLYSNYYKDATADNTYLSNVGISIATNGGIYIYDSNYTTSDVSLYKTWLSTHNTIVYYPLASPTYEKLNDTLQEELNSIRLLEGLNNIMSSVPIELEYYVEKTPIRIPLSIIEKYEVGEPYTIERVVYESGVIKYETSDDDTLSTLYLDASNEYIESQEQVDYIKDMLNGFTVDSVNTGRVLGNPAIDAYDLIEVYDDDDDNEPTIFKTFANNTYTYTGINRNTFDTQIGIEERTENVSISGEANFQKWAKTSINNLEGSIELNAGEIDDLDNRLKETKLIVDTDSARIDTVEESFNEDGSVKALKTTNYTFDADGLRIGKSTDDYNSLQDNTGTYYYEKDTMTGKYTKDGSVQKDLALFGTYYYGIDEENFNVATFTRDDALFIAQLYEKTYTDKNGNQVTKNAVGHFYNGR